VTNSGLPFAFAVEAGFRMPSYTKLFGKQEPRTLQSVVPVASVIAVVFLYTENMIICPTSNRVWLFL
jgi:hypothetical protein